MTAQNQTTIFSASSQPCLSQDSREILTRLAQGGSSARREQVSGGGVFRFFFGTKKFKRWGVLEKVGRNWLPSGELT